MIVVRTGAWLAIAGLLVLANGAVFLWRDGRNVPVAAGVTTPAAAHEAQAPPGADAFPTAMATSTSTSTPAPAAGVPRRADAASPMPASGAPALLMPVQGVAVADVHDTFDQARGSERRHEALDVMAPAGTPVLAVADGHIEKLFTSDRGGLTVYQFDPTGTWSYYYAHLQAYAPGLIEGMQVRRGDVLGTVGSSGNADPAAPHLHFAVSRLTPERQWWTGEPVNPYPLLEGAPPAR